MDVFENITDLVIARLGREIEYNGLVISAGIEKNSEAEKQGGLVMSDVTVEIRKTDVPLPSCGDSVLIDDEQRYKVGQIISEDDHSWVLSANKVEQ